MQEEIYYHDKVNVNMGFSFIKCKLSTVRNARGATSIIFKNDISFFPDAPEEKHELGQGLFRFCFVEKLQHGEEGPRRRAPIRNFLKIPKTKGLRASDRRTNGLLFLDQNYIEDNAWLV